MKGGFNQEQFCKDWTTSMTIEEVSRKQKCSKRVATARAYLLRIRGVKLKRFRVRPERSIEQLNQIIRESK